MRTNLKEKVALVTGASSGLGSRFARVLAANGALTVLAARRIERLKDLRAEIEAAGGAAHVVTLDVTDPESIREAVDRTESEVGPIDILVNNSGVSTHPAAGRRDSGGLRLRPQHQPERRFLRRQRGGAPDDRARQGAVRLPRPHRQHRLGRRPAGAAADRRVLHQQGGRDPDDPGAGARVGALRHQRQRLCPGYIRTEINDAHWDTEAGHKLMQMLPRKRIGDPRTSTARCC
jgi:hypothetical protein